MKSYEEFARSVFEKSEKLEEQNRRRRKAALAAVPSAVAAVVILTVSVFLFRSGIRTELKKVGPTSSSSVTSYTSGFVSGSVSGSASGTSSGAGTGPADISAHSQSVAVGTSAVGVTSRETTTVYVAPEPAGTPVTEAPRTTAAPTTRPAATSRNTTVRETATTAPATVPVTTAAPMSFVPTTVLPTFAPSAPEASTRAVPTSAFVPNYYPTVPVTAEPGGPDEQLRFDVVVNAISPQRVESSRYAERPVSEEPGIEGAAPLSQIISGEWYGVESSVGESTSSSSSKGVQFAHLDDAEFISFVIDNELEPTEISDVLNCYVVEVTEGDYRYYVLSRVGTDIIAMRFSGGSAEDAVRYFLENL